MKGMRNGDGRTQFKMIYCATEPTEIEKKLDQIFQNFFKAKTNIFCRNLIRQKSRKTHKIDEFDSIGFGKN